MEMWKRRNLSLFSIAPKLGDPKEENMKMVHLTNLVPTVKKGDS